MSAEKSVHSVIGQPARRRRWQMLAPTTIAVLAVGGYWLYLQPPKKDLTQYQTTAVKVGDLTVSVSATGNLQPTNEVDVGSELSGMIDNVMVDENDKVHKGQILAQLDTAKLHDQITRSQAALAAAQASVLQAQASVTESQHKLARLQDMSRLSQGKMPARVDLDTAEANVARAKADLASTKAAVTQAEAALSTDQTNLAKASIRSPIEGVVLTRKVERGQTVAASLQAPVLFTLAEDLAQMELQVDVDEADIGQVHEGQPTHFSVDAWPNQQFPAQITRVGLGSQTKDGVVTYKTILRVDNQHLLLRPGMTATAEIVTAERHHVLLVPNAALRFTPPQTSEVSQKRSLVGSLIPHPPSEPAKNNHKKANGQQQVWVLQQGQPIAINVTTGVSDGQDTEITSTQLSPTMTVITDITSSKP